MSDNDNADTPESLPADANFGAEENAQPEVAKPKRRGGLVALLAILLLTGALAAGAYWFLQQDRSASDVSGDALAEIKASIADLTAQQQALSEQFAALSARETSTTSALQESGNAIDELQRGLTERAQLFDSLPTRMSGIERSVAALQGVSIEARNTYLIAEAEYYLQIGNAQLMLANNPYLAGQALEQADDRLEQLGDPALTDTRRALADELAALSVMEKPDLAGVSLTLASLARVADSLPLRRPGNSENDISSVEETDSQSGLVRAWGSVKNAADSLIDYTAPGNEHAPLLTPDAEPLIRSNLSLQLQAARLALLRGEQELFRQSLDDADTWLSVYFDTTSEPVAAARSTIEEIATEQQATETPDISTSLRLLRQYRTLAESAE